ncbi:hypothetical protein KI387_037922, partial [Taxus chinensis]
GGDDGCSTVGGGDEQASPMGQRGIIDDDSLGGEAIGEVVLMLTEGSFTGEGGDEGYSSVGGGI